MGVSAVPASPTGLGCLYGSLPVILNPQKKEDGPCGTVLNLVSHEVSNKRPRLGHQSYKRLIESRAPAEELDVTTLKQADARDLLSRHGKKWRKLGATTVTIEVLRCLVNLQLQGKRPKFSDVARCLGVNRSVVTRHIKRAETIGMVIRVGGTVILNVKSLLRWSKEALEEIRKHLAALNYKKSLRLRSLDFTRKPKIVDTVSTHTVPKGNSNRSTLETMELAQSRGIVEGYIPVHLRKAK